MEKYMEIKRMLLTDNSFAEKIIEKYSSVEPYYFDNDLLVFYRENPWRQTKTSAVSYIELALKLLFAVQNYCQSGQQISLNWNMVNQVILKQTAAISAKTEKILSPVRKEINRLLLEKEQIRKQDRSFRTEIYSQQIDFGKSDAGQDTLDFIKNNTKQQIVAFRKGILELYILDFWKQRVRKQPANLIIEGLQQQISVFEREQTKQQMLFSKEERIKQLRFFRQEQVTKQLQLFGKEKVTKQQFLKQIQLQETKIRKQSLRLDKKLDKELSLRESEERIRRKEELYSKAESKNKVRVSFEKHFQSEFGIHLADWKFSDFQISKWLPVQSQNRLSQFLQNQLPSFYENQSDFEKITSFDIQSAKQLQTLINVQLEIQRFSVEKAKSLFYKSMELQTKKQMYGNSGYQALQTSARWLQRITSLFLTLSRKTENTASQTGKQIHKLTLTDAISANQILRAGTKDFQQLPINLSLKSVWHQWDLMEPIWDRQHIMRILAFNRIYLSSWFRHLIHEEIQRVWQSLLELKGVSRRKGLLENIIKLNHTPELDTLSTSNALETSWEIMVHKLDTSLSFQQENKSSLTHLAEEEPDAMQKLFQLLWLYSSATRVQEQIKRVFHSYESTIAQSMQQPKEVLLSSGFIKRHGFIFYRQGKRNFSVQESEERIRTFIELLEKPKVLAAVRKQMERVQKEEARKNGMIQQHSDHRVVTILNLEKQEKRQMISQVRQNFGIEAAKKLEQYLILKEHISGDATDQESQRQIDDLAKSMIDSYYKINWTKTFITAMGADSENHLYNQIREKVHEPPEKSVKQLRSNLDLIMWLAQRKHRFGQEKINLAAKIQEYLQMKAITQFLQRRIVYKDNTFPNSLLYALGEQAKFNIPSYRSEIPTFHTIIPKSDSSQISVSRDDIRAANFEKPQEWGETQTEFFRKQKAHENQMEETKRLMTTLHKKVEIQEKLLTELKKGVQQGKVPEPININNLTRQVMRKMEDELRIEKMRRGLL